jgi:6-phosphogluconolactonase
MKKTIRFWIIALLIVAGITDGYSQAKDIIYAGTNSTRGSKGIYVLELDRSSGKLTEIQTVGGGSSPNFLVVSPDRKTLYAAYSTGTLPEGGGSVMSFRINPSNGHLTKINEQSSEGRGPAHVSIDPKGRFVYISNYGEGNLSVYPVNNDGSLAKASDVVQHSGSSIVQGRQEAPHVHSVVPSADGKFIYVSDLGIDKIMIYEVQNNGKLKPAVVPFAQNTPGSGPRHFAIHPNGNFAYSAEELSSTVASFTVNKATGALSPLERVNMLPDGFTERNSAADIHFSPDGKSLYASNRGHESLVIYAVDARTGKMEVVGHQNTGGKHPRNFMVDKKGEFVLTANRDTDNAVVFRRDKSTGKLSSSGEELTIPAVICLVQL